MRDPVAGFYIDDDISSVFVSAGTILNGRLLNVELIIFWTK
jgi:hypothetical protein